VVGLPFHPKTGSNADGSIVHAAAAGLLNNPNVMAGDYVRFLFLMPGAKYPAARAATINTAGGLSLTPAQVHLNPYRVTDGEQIYVQRAVANTGTAFNVQVVVWSTLDGLEFYAEFNGVGVVPGPRTIVTATGSAIIEMTTDFPTPPPPPGPDPTYVVQYAVITVKSNCVVVPHEPASDPGGWGSWFTTVPEAFDNCFAIPPAGSPGGDRVTDWLNDVVETGNPITTPAGFYQIPEGAVGKGWVLVLWRNQAYEGTVEDGSLAPGSSYGGAVWYDGPETEWNYDWLVESGQAGAASRLWGNCPAIANPVAPLESFHTPDDPAGQYRSTDPPWYVASAFISSRLEVPLTRDVRSSANTPVETTGAARIFVGQTSGGQVDGSYETGVVTPAREASLNNRMTAVLKCPECGSVLTTLSANQCEYCNAALSSTDDRVDGDTAFATTLLQPPSLRPQDSRWPTLNPDANPNPRNLAVANRVSLPFAALKWAPTLQYVAPARSLDLLFFADLPRSTPPSVPPLGLDGIRPNMVTNDGYVGRLFVYCEDEPLGGQEGFDPTQPDQPEWMRGYRCPSCRQWTFGQVPGPCTNTSGTNPCKGYRVCPVCAVASPVPDPPTATTACPFCGRQLDGGNNYGPTDSFCGAPRITEEDLDAEEYDIFEVQVSVQRELQMAGGAGGVELGRVAPGVPPGEPDTTVRTGGVVPAEPGDVTLPPRPFRIVNSGNVRATLEPRGTDLARADTDLLKLSPLGLAGRVPLAAGTVFAWRWDGKPLSGMPAVPGAAGAPRGEPTGAALQAGDRSNPKNLLPVPLGQPAGTHSGTLVTLTDHDADGIADIPTASFDVSLRVGEARIPQNDYFSADVAPVLSFDLDDNGQPVGLHLVWMTNRPLSSGTDVDEDVAPVTDPTGARAPDAPFNLVYANADLQPPAGLYRHYEWQASGGGIAEAKALTIDSGAGVVNESPFVLTFRGGSAYERLALWHRLRPTAGGWDSTLRFVGAGTSGYASGAGGYLHTAADVQALRALNVAAPTDPLVLWLFWHQGPKGHETISYLPNVRPPAVPNTADARPLPVSLALGSRPHDERQDVVLPGLGAVSVHRFAASPFTYVRDPYAWLMIDPGSESQVELLNVAFTGHVRHDENTDICWVRFAWDPNGGLTKVGFPRLTGRVGIPGSGLKAGERLRADAKRQVFSTRHLEWAVHDVAGDNYGMAPTAFDPKLLLAVTAGGNTYVYRITWDPHDPPKQRWVRERNAYVVQPRFAKIWPTDGVDPLFAARAYPGDPAGGYRLVDPPTAQMPTPRPLMAEITPATGVVTFSSPLFNSEAPDDASAVLNLSNVAAVSDVQLYADYTPLVWRICRDPAADDSPFAFWRPEDTGGLTIFWRRTFSPADPPFEGRSIFVYKQFAPAVQLQYPRVSGHVQYWHSGSWEDLPDPPYKLYRETGCIVDTSMTLAAPPSAPTLLQYTGYGAVRQERRVFLGWTEERRVPVETEAIVGPFSVAQETYGVDLGNQGTRDVTRFWLAWSSPRAVYDLRTVAAGGGDWRQSADVYLATVVTNLHTAVPEPVE
ncbi:MAG: hypothetical protein N2512_09465, partial [Armatimonadetes bacterium]|nr:hypothetical protein [Armatimonadota bacterium]